MTNLLSGHDDEDDEVNLLTRPTQVGGVLEASDQHVSLEDGRHGASVGRDTVSETRERGEGGGASEGKVCTGYCTRNKTVQIRRRSVR